MLELTVVIAVLAVALYFLIGGLGFTAGKAADVVREQTLANVEAALRYEAASRIARGRSSEIAGLAAESPARWMQDRPHDYLGEYPGHPVRLPNTAVWYWDSGSRQLVFLAAGSDAATRGEWRYRIVADSANEASPRLEQVVSPRRKQP